MNIISTIVICLLVSFISVWLAKKLKISVVIGLIVAGIILGLPAIKNVVFGENMEFISVLGDIGIIALMFLAGMEISWGMLYKEKKDSVYLAALAFIVPFILGFVIFWGLGFSMHIALIIGICMSITAEATKARVLLELNKLKTRVGSLMMGAGIIDDILGIVLFSLVSLLLVNRVATKPLIMLFVAILSFFIGIIVNKSIGKKNGGLQSLEKFLLIFVVPFFFISMGLAFSIKSIALDPWLLIIMIVIAIFGKILGSILSKPFTKLRIKQLVLVGWGMNSRGAIELAIAFTAFKSGFLTAELYSGLIIMALVTTLIFPFFLRKMVKKNPNILE